MKTDGTGNSLPNGCTFHTKRFATSSRNGIFVPTIQPAPNFLISSRTLANRCVENAVKEGVKELQVVYSPPLRPQEEGNGPTIKNRSRIFGYVPRPKQVGSRTASFVIWS